MPENDWAETAYRRLVRGIFWAALMLSIFSGLVACFFERDRRAATGQIAMSMAVVLCLGTNLCGYFTDKSKRTRIFLALFNAALLVVGIALMFR